MTEHSTTRGGLSTSFAPVLRWVLGLTFLFVGALHFIVPDRLPAPMSWMYELSDEVHYFAGVVEILGGLGLILPTLTGIAPRLTGLAAAGLVLVMLGAILWHAGRGEMLPIVGNALLVVALAYVAYASEARPADWSTRDPTHPCGRRGMSRQRLSRGPGCKLTDSSVAHHQIP